MRPTLIPLIFLVLTAAMGAEAIHADTTRVFDAEHPRTDQRQGELKSPNSYFPMREVSSQDDWDRRKADIKRRILISQGLWPSPTKTPLHPDVHSRQDFGDYTIEAVSFQSVPGHYVTGSLYRPQGKPGPYPAVLCPHGHWADGRFYDAGEEAAKLSIVSGGERFISAARNHIQARCVQLARMGCIAFLYDSTGNADSIQLTHRHERSDLLDRTKDWGFFSVQADLRLQNMMGLQTWNSIRSIDFLAQLPDVDATRIGVTGASGGGTQSMIIAAVDERIAAAMPCVMVSTAMQGGCSCENAPYLRIDQGNVDIAAVIAPRPLALTAADDWTVELETKGYPSLKRLYQLLGVKNRLTAAFNVHFRHNYNHVNRTVMYGFFNRHFNLGLDEPILEQDFKRLDKAQLTVWNQSHPAPSGDQIGDPHEIKLLRLATQDSDDKMSALVPDSESDVAAYLDVVGKAWKTIIGRQFVDVGEIVFEVTSSSTRDETSQQLGRLTHAKASEQIPALKVSAPHRTLAGVVIWVGNDGKADLFNEKATADLIGSWVNRGYTVITADLSMQGELIDGDQPADRQAMWFQRKGVHVWENYAGYTYGYNHSLFVQRAHDVLSLIKYGSSIAGDLPIMVVAQGQDAGPIALAALSQSTGIVEHAFIDVDGFRFADVRRHDSPRFVPGSVKYLDIDGLLSCCVPNKVTIAGIADDSIARRIYRESKRADRLVIADHDRLIEKLQTIAAE
tara:strand:+ start:188694 stop:190892 length:2199 start_codon:yes stop_codon:yes gene_type:complete